MIDTILSVSEWNTIEPGPQTLKAQYTDSHGNPIEGAIVIATGDTAGLPVTFRPGHGGMYAADLTIAPDSDGLKRTIKVIARKAGYATRVAYVSYFVGDATWIARNDHVERRLQSWASQYPGYVSLEHETCYEGYPVYAVTVTERDTTTNSKRNALFIQSHGNEMAATAAMMDVIHQLLTGETQEGRRSDLDRERICKDMLLFFIPIGNAGGRERCPVQYWGDQFNREVMDSFTYSRPAVVGEGEPHRDRDHRSLDVASILHRSEAELDPAYPIGIKFEQVDEDTFLEPFLGTVPLRYVEPTEYANICANVENEPMIRTALWRLVKAALDRHQFQTAIDLHQGAIKLHQDPATGAWVFEDAGQIYIRDPDLEGFNRDQLQYAHELATRIENEWRAEGIDALPRSFLGKSLEETIWNTMTIVDFMHMYGKGNPATFFVEVTKGPGTTKAMQKRASVSSIISTINYVLNPESRK